TSRLGSWSPPRGGAGPPGTWLLLPSAGTAASSPGRGPHVVSAATHASAATARRAPVRRGSTCAPSGPAGPVHGLASSPTPTRTEDVRTTTILLYGASAHAAVIWRTGGAAANFL